MAVSGFQHTTTLGANNWADTDTDENAVDNIDNGPTTLNMVVVDNTGNAAIEYFKMWNDGDPVVGTDGMDIQIPVAASSKQAFFFREGAEFDTGLSYTTTSDAGTAGNTAPGAAVTAYLTTNGGNS